MRNIGASKYVLNYHDGEKKHDDGSDFYDIEISNNYKNIKRKIAELKKLGYREQ